MKVKKRKRKKGTGNKEQGTGIREQGTGNMKKEKGKGKRGKASYIFIVYVTFNITGGGGLLVFFDNDLTTFKNRNYRFICKVEKNYRKIEKKI